MRRFTVVILLCLSAACGLAEDERDEENRNIYPTFYDKPFEAYCLERFDLNSDGRISRYEMQRVVEIDCSDRNVVTLTDLREFKNLRRLVCTRNRLVTLDLRTCQALERVDCSENELTGVVTGQLRSLTELDCHANRITSLDFSSNGSLRRVDCRRNALTTLDVSTCARPMTAVDARGCVALTTIYVASDSQVGSLQYDGEVSVVVR